MSKISIGVIGFSQQRFDKDAAHALLEQAIHKFCAVYGRDNLEIVSGLTNLGVPAIAYDIAEDLGLHTVGIACSKAKDYECYPVDETVIVGDNWGDESRTFLDHITHLIKCGGGEQSKKEAAEFVAVHGKGKFIDIPLAAETEEQP